MNGHSLPRQDVYTMRIPLDDIATIRQCFPKFGQDSIIITVKEGHALNPFYFYEGGVRDMIRIVRQILPFAPTEGDPDLFTKVQHVLSVDYLPPPPSESHPDQVPYSATHFKQNISGTPPERPGSPLQATWGFLNNVKKLAKDASASSMFVEWILDEIIKFSFCEF